MASTKIRTGRRQRLRDSLRNTAAASPRGSDQMRARPTSSMVPTRAWAPPPAVAGSVGVMPAWSCTKNPKRSALTPSTMM